MVVHVAGQASRWAALNNDPVRRARIARDQAQRDAEGRSEPVTRERPVLAAFPAAPAPAVAGPVLHLYGEVGWDIRADDLAASLGQLGGRDVTVYLSSPGGEAASGIDCYSLLARHGGEVTVIVDALAASAASVIAMAASPGRLFVSAASLLMVHEAWTVTGGPASEHRQAADLLDKMSGNIASIYAARSGLPAAHWLTAMQAETWYTGPEAVAAGLADAVVSGAAVSPAGDGDGELSDSDFAMIGAAMIGQILAMAGPDSERGFHPDGTPVTKAERRAAFEAYARAQARRKAPGNGQAFNAVSAEAGASEFVKRVFGLD